MSITKPEKQMIVFDIIKKHLKDNGFDGLYNDDFECACVLSDLQPCGDDFSGCKPGYKRNDPSREHDFLICGEKELKK